MLQINTNLTAFDTWNSIHGGTVSPRATKYIHKLIKKGLVDVLCEGFTDLDDPPPKTLPIEGVPLAEIVVGSSAPKNEEEASGLAEVGLTD